MRPNLVRLLHGCQHVTYMLLRLRPYPVRGHWLLGKSCTDVKLVGLVQVQTEMMGDIHHYAWRARHRNQTVYINKRDSERFGDWTSNQCAVRLHLVQHLLLHEYSSQPDTWLSLLMHFTAKGLLASAFVQALLPDDKLHSSSSV